MTKSLQSALLLCTLFLTPLHADKLQVFLLAGQSNMEGYGYTYLGENADAFNLPSLEFLVTTPDYVSILPAATYTFKSELHASWLDPRDDAWAVHYDSLNGVMRQVEPTRNTEQGAWATALMPLGPGFGVDDNHSSFSCELGMGIHLADRIQEPLLLVKSDHGGRSLAVDFRPPSAAADRGGSVGGDYTNTVNSIKAVLNDLDADLVDNGVLDAYHNATGYEVAGFVWLQGWNDMGDAAFRAEYEENLVDLVEDLRASDGRIPADMPAIISESADQNAELNVARANAVATLNAANPGSAVFIENNNMIGNNWGAQGYPFSLDFGSHFNARAENYLEIGWRIGVAAIANGYVTESPLLLSHPGVSSNAFNAVGLVADINANADQVVVVWGSVDLGTTSFPGTWPNQQTIAAPWTGGAAQVPATISGLSENTGYVFRYYASSAALSVVAWSYPIAVTTPLQFPPPVLETPSETAVTDHGATVTCQLLEAGADVSLAWAYEDQGESSLATWSTAPGGGTVSLGTAVADQILNHTITGLQIHSYYSYRFFATNGTGSDWSEAGSFGTGLAGAEPVSLGKNYAYLTYQPGQNPGVGPHYLDEPHASTLGTFDAGELTDGILNNSTGSTNNPMTAFHRGGGTDVPQVDIVFDLGGLHVITDIVIGNASRNCCGTTAPDSVDISFSSTDPLTGYGTATNYGLWAGYPTLPALHTELSTGATNPAAQFVKLSFPTAIGIEKYVLDEITIMGLEAASDLVLEIASSGPSLTFTWNSQPGASYNIRKGTDLSIDSATWEIFKADATNPLVETRPPGVSALFFVVEEVPE